MAEEEWRIRALDRPVLERSSPWLIELQEVKKSGVGGEGDPEPRAKTLKG